MGLIDSVNNLNNVYISERQKRKQEQEEKQNKKIRQNNYKLELQQYFYNEFKKQNNTEKTKKYFDTLENRLQTIGNIAKNKEDEFATRELNLLYNKELNFIYNIFKNDEEAQEKNIEQQIYTGIQTTYQKHGLNAFYKLQDVKYNFLNQYNINCQKYDFYFDKINKHFYKYYKSIQEEEKQTNNIFYYILAILTGGLIRWNCWNQRNKK